MKIILKKEVPDLGEANELVNVADGYARNFLFPRNLAVAATPKEIAAAEKRRQAHEQKLMARKADFEALAQKLSALEVLITADKGEGNKLFGAVTAQDIAKAIEEQTGAQVEKRKIEIPAPIKTLGDYLVKVKIFQEIAAQVKVRVVSQPA